MTPSRDLAPGLDRRRFLELVPLGALSALACQQSPADDTMTDVTEGAAPRASGGAGDATAPTVAPAATATPTKKAVIPTNDDGPFCIDLYIGSALPVPDLTIEPGGPRMREQITWLRLRSDLGSYVAPEQPPLDDDVTSDVPPVFADGGLAVMVQTGHHSTNRRDSWFPPKGQVIGLYHGSVSANTLARLRDAFESIEWAKLPRPLGGDQRSPSVTLGYARGDLVIERRFNVDCHEFIRAIQPIWDLLEQRRESLSRRPARALVGSVSVDQPSGSSLERTCSFEIENRGQGPVVLTDPRLPVGAADRPRLVLAVGELPGGTEFPPLEWTELPVPAMPKGAPRSLVLQPKQRFEFSAPWTATKPGSYVLRGRWRDQQGALDPAPDQLPFMPLAKTGPSALGPGPYPIRGSVTAVERFEVTS